MDLVCAASQDNFATPDAHLKLSGYRLALMLRMLRPHAVGVRPCEATERVQTRLSAAPTPRPYPSLAPRDCTPPFRPLQVCRKPPMCAPAFGEEQEPGAGWGGSCCSLGAGISLRRPRAATGYARRRLRASASTSARLRGP